MTGFKFLWRCGLAWIAMFLAPFAWCEDRSPPIAPIPTECRTGSETSPSASLPNVAEALKGRKTIVVLSIGASAALKPSDLGGDYLEAIENFLEQTFKGLDVTVINRGVSGELARDAAERLKLEVALTKADLVLWQLGTADAFAQIPLADFRLTVTDTLRWLKERRVDVVLIGLQYFRNAGLDPNYRATRNLLREIATEEKTLLIGRYEIVETLAQLRRQQGDPLTDYELSDANFDCMAEYLARAVASSIYKNDATSPKPGPGAPLPSSPSK